MQTANNTPVLYEEDRPIKISRFFEVAAFLSENDLWGEVESILSSTEILGSRIVLDKALGNAVKITVARHIATKDEQFAPDHIAELAIRCGSWRTPPDPQRPPTPSIPPNEH